MIENRNYDWLRIFISAFSRPKIIYNFVKLITCKNPVIKSDGILFNQKLGYGNGVWAALGGLNYDSEIQQALYLIESGDVVIDLGANIGCYTLRFAEKVGPVGKVVAVEASSSLYENLVTNIKLNNFQNVEAVHAAAGDKSADVELSWSKNRENSGSVVRCRGEMKEKIKQICLDDLIEEMQISKIKLIKIDIEGAEKNALTGMRKILEQQTPIILFENSDPETLTFLQKSNYRIGRFKNRLFFETTEGENLWAVPLTFSY